MFASPLYTAVDSYMNPKCHQLTSQSAYAAMLAHACWGERYHTLKDKLRETADRQLRL